MRRTAASRCTSVLWASQLCRPSSKSPTLKLLLRLWLRLSDRDVVRSSSPALVLALVRGPSKRPRHKRVADAEPVNGRRPAPPRRIVL
jgi:hypothetical protein